MPDGSRQEGETVACPHCEEPTWPNALSDGTVVCSCAAERPLPSGHPGANAQQPQMALHGSRALPSRKDQDRCSLSFPTPQR